MRESTIYQAILREGRQEGLQEGREEGLQEGRQEGLQEGLQEGRRGALVEEARRILMLLGSDRWGAASADVNARVQEIQDHLELGRLIKHISKASSWEELISSAR